MKHLFAFFPANPPTLFSSPVPAPRFARVCKIVLKVLKCTADAANHFDAMSKRRNIFLNDNCFWWLNKKKISSKRDFMIPEYLK